MAILGIDEVGRGPLAGPLVVGAVVLPEERAEWVEELKDSKRLSAKKREILNEIILQNASATGLGWVSPTELDEGGISNGLKLATKRAVKSVQELKVPFSQIVIDGKVNFLADTTLEEYVSVMPKADDLIKEVSAASIIAKVARDRYMYEVAKIYPKYGFEKHVGYGTAMHRKAIEEYGICPEHRRSFEPIRTMVGYKPKQTVVKNTTNIGKKAEEKAAEYLSKEGHKIIARNFKTYYYEIDLISLKGENIYFTEVKYRSSRAMGGGTAAVNKRKIAKMKFAAECFMNYYVREMDRYNPLLAVADVSGEDFLMRSWFPLLDD